MGNSYCSSCECVKSDKQNEFDDGKQNPMPESFKGISTTDSNI